MKLLGSTKSKITKQNKTKQNNNKKKTLENVPNLEMTAVVLVHCNIANNDCRQDSRELHTFVPNELFGQSLVLDGVLLR